MAGSCDLFKLPFDVLDKVLKLLDELEEPQKGTRGTDRRNLARTCKRLLYIVFVESIQPGKGEKQGRDAAVDAAGSPDVFDIRVRLPENLDEGSKFACLTSQTDSTKKQKDDVACFAGWLRLLGRLCPEGSTLRVHIRISNVPDQHPDAVNDEDPYRPRIRRLLADRHKHCSQAALEAGMLSDNVLVTSLATCPPADSGEFSTFLMVREPAAAIAQLETLEHLDLLDEACVVGNTSGLQHLTQLTWLRLAGDTMYGPQRFKLEHLGGMRHLQHLHLEVFRMPEQLPSEIAALRGLTHLWLAANPQPGLPDSQHGGSSSSGLEGGFEHLAALTSLLELRLVHAGITEVPEPLGRLSSLTHLSLQHAAHLGGGWEHLVRLRQLKQLDLRACYLEDVPQHLSKLRQLSHLDLSMNPLPPVDSGSWARLQRAAELKRLDLVECNLTDVPIALKPLLRSNNLCVELGLPMALPPHPGLVLVPELVPGMEGPPPLE